MCVCVTSGCKGSFHCSNVIRVCVKEPIRHFQMVTAHTCETISKDEGLEKLHWLNRPLIRSSDVEDMDVMDSPNLVNEKIQDVENPGDHCEAKLSSPKLQEMVSTDVGVTCKYSGINYKMRLP